MMDATERRIVLDQMHEAAGMFYRMAVRIGNHPFIEFTGLMNEYIKACESAHRREIDFTDCSAHSGRELPLKDYELQYINEKLECIFGGRISLFREATITPKDAA